MTGLVLGCDLGSSGLPVFEDIPLPDAEITAVTPPAMAPLYDGQSIGDVAGFDEMIRAENFTSTAGPITAVDVTFTGDASDAAHVLVEGESAGFSVTVTDSTGHSQSFDAGIEPVQYRLRLTKTESNEALIDINPLVPGSDVLTIDLSGQSGYDGSHDAPVAGLRNGPYNLVRPVVQPGADPESPCQGDEGLWLTPTGDLVLTRHWMRDGVEIPGATGTTYLPGPADVGASITLRVTGDDGVNAPVTVFSEDLQFPAAAPSVSLDSIGDLQFDNQANKVPVTATLDTGAPDMGKTLIIELVWGDQDASDGNQVAATLDGVAMTVLATAGLGRENVTILSADVSGADEVALEMTIQQDVAWRGWSYRAWVARGHTALIPLADSTLVPGGLSLNADVQEGDRLVGGVILGSRGSDGDVAFSGATVDAESPNTSGARCHYHLSAQVDGAETARTITATATGDAAGTLAGAFLLIR